MFSYGMFLSKHNGLIRLLSFCTVACLLVMPTEAHGQDQPQQQRSDLIKLQVKMRESVTLGKSAHGEIFLVDADNKEIVAPKDLTITLTMISATGKTLPSQEVTIKKGHHDKSFDLNLTDEPGTVKIQATNDELQPDGVFLDVRLPILPKATSSKPHRSKPRKPKYKASFRNPDDFLRLPDWSFERPAQLVPVMFTQSDSDGSDLKIEVGASRPYYGADGKDQAKVYAILKQQAPKDLDITLYTTMGTLERNVLHFNKGDKQKSTLLTSEKAGTAYVSFVKSEPDMQLECPKELEVKFVTPITGYVFEVFPSRIPFIDKADLVVRLDNKGSPVETDVDRLVSFRINSDIGKLSANSITIKAGSSEQWASFIPVKQGEVTITAVMANFPSREQKLAVETPVMFLVLSAIGGLIGGLIAFWVSKNSRWWRIVVGLVTGFVLYWACIFISISSLPRGVVLNILTSLALPILGGWLGTEVFNIVLKKLGIIH
jgi:hypothetical protein